MYEDLFKDVRKKKEKELARVITLYEQSLNLINDGLYEQACAVLREAVEPSDSGELYNWGALYYNGLGVEQNYERARFWFQKSANKGDAKAQTGLGYMYYLGLGVDKDYEKAFSYFNKAACQNDAGALESLGALYWNGEAVEKDKGKALEYFVRAAEEGSKLGCYNAARAYCFGDESLINIEKSWQYLQRLPSLDYDKKEYFKAHYMAGMYYLKKPNLKKISRAMFHFSEGAYLGDQDSQYVLGILLLAGIGTEKDAVRGMEWIEKAAKNESEEANAFLSSDDESKLDKAVDEIMSRY